MSVCRYLIDVNLPKYFSFFHSPEFEFVIDINAKWPDRDIWDYAREHGLIIVTKIPISTIVVCLINSRLRLFI